MDRMLYIAMSAAKQMLKTQAVAANNLANVHTTGFKADYEAVRAMPLFGPGYPSRVFAMAERPGVNYDVGTLETTGNELDIAIKGEGFIAVSAPDGSEAYTRAGDLQLTMNGQLQTGGGHAVLGNGGPIAVPQSETLLIGDDGTISVRPLGQEANTLAQVDRIKLVNPPLKDLIKGEDGLFRLRDGGVPPPDADVRVTRGVLEGSNVNSVAEMINMINNARNYEMAVKAMRTAQEIDSNGGRVMRVG